MKTYTELTAEEKRQTYDNWQALCVEYGELTLCGSFEEYDKEQRLLDLTFDEETLECIG